LTSLATKLFEIERVGKVSTLICRKMDVIGTARYS
jgi:hypothetical protein